MTKHSLYPCPLLQEIEISAMCSIKYCWTLFACRGMGNTIGTATMNNGTKGTWGLVFTFSQDPKENYIFLVAVAQNLISCHNLDFFLSHFYFLPQRMQECGTIWAHISPRQMPKDCTTAAQIIMCNIYLQALIGCVFMKSKLIHCRSCVGM